MNCVRAFFVGGAICTIGEGIKQAVMHWLHLGEKDALLAVTVTSCTAKRFSSQDLTLYSKITKFGGAGGLVPITGFANSVKVFSRLWSVKKRDRCSGSELKSLQSQVRSFCTESYPLFFLGIIYMILVRLGVM